MAVGVVTSRAVALASKRRSAESSAFKPAVQSERVLLPGERRFFSLDEHELQACCKTAESSPPHIVVLCERPFVPFDQATWGTLAEVETRPVSSGGGNGTVRLLGVAAAAIMAVRRGAYASAALQAQPPPYGRISERRRRLLISFLKSNGRWQGERSRAPFQLMSDQELILQLVEWLDAGEELRFRLLVAASVPEQARFVFAEANARTHPERRLPRAKREEEKHRDLPAAVREALEGTVHSDRFDSGGALERLVEGIEWTAPEVHPISLAQARRHLDEFVGMQPVKDEVLDLLAAWEWQRRRGQAVGDLRGRNLCLVGPPGVGKTSIVRAIAEASGRMLIHMPMGGVDDVFIAGADQAYNKSRPGEVVRRVHQSGRHPSELVILLDEIDKIPQTGSRSPLPLLLELLDPEQRSGWRDHFMDMIPLDLSGTLFVCTANELEAMAAPLKDRLQPLVLPGYSREEQELIGSERLWPRLLRQHGIRDEVQLAGDVVPALVARGPSSPGMRQLQGQLERVLQRSLRRLLEGETCIHVDSSLALAWTVAPRDTAHLIGFRAAGSSAERYRRAALGGSEALNRTCTGVGSAKEADDGNRGYDHPAGG